MPVKCYVPGCNKNSTTDPRLQFYQFPKSDLVNQWLKAIENGTGQKLDLLRFNFSTDRICEVHFKPENFIIVNNIKVRKIAVVPSLFWRGYVRKGRPTADTPPAKEQPLTELPTELKCRICYKSRGVTNIRDLIPKIGVTVTEAIKKTFSYYLKSQICFPQKICYRCLNFLITAHMLKLELLNTESKLISIEEELRKKPEEIPNESSPLITRIAKLPPVTTVEASEENAVFIIKELPDGVEIKQEPELSIEGDQEAFTETLSDDEIKKEPEIEIVDEAGPSELHDDEKIEESESKHETDKEESEMIIEDEASHSELHIDEEHEFEQEIEDHASSRKILNSSEKIKRVQEVPLKIFINERVAQNKELEQENCWEADGVAGRKINVDRMLQEALKQERRKNKQLTKQYEEWPEEKERKSRRKKRKRYERKVEEVSEDESQTQEEPDFNFEESSSEEEMTIEEEPPTTSQAVKLDTPLDLDKMLEEALKREQKEKFESYEKWPHEKEREMKLQKKRKRVRRAKVNDPDKPPAKVVKKERKLPKLEDNEKGPRRNPNEPYFCKKCNKEEDGFHDLVRHVDFSTEGCIEAYEPKFECYLCHRKFIFNINKKQHIKNDHFHDIPFNGECPHCKRSSEHYKNPIFYERHLKSHLIDPIGICSECGKKFYCGTAFSQHKYMHKRESGIYIRSKTHVSRKNLTYYCDFCDFGGDSKTSIKIHLKTHSDSAKTMCELCSKVVWNSQALQAHKFRIHKLTSGCFYCKSCDYCFHLRFQFKKHIKKCNGPTGKKHPPDCVRVPRKDMPKDVRIKEL